jgi:hypothetical protein
LVVLQHSWENPGDHDKFAVPRTTFASSRQVMYVVARALRQTGEKKSEMELRKRWE